MILFVGFTQLHAITDSLFNKASDLYQQEKYETPSTATRKSLIPAYEAADLYYNMGNAAFRSNSIGYSVLYYEKALKLDPSHQDAAHNLEYVSRYIVDAFEEVPELFIRSWISSVVHLLPEHTWSILALLGFVLMLASLLLYLFTKGLALKKAGFFAALLGTGLFHFHLSASLAQHRSIVHPGSGIIISPSVDCQKHPQ